MSRCPDCNEYIDDKWKKGHVERCKVFNHVKFFTSKWFWITEISLTIACIYFYLTLF